LQLAPGDSIFSAVAPKGTHTRSNPILPLATPEIDPEKIIKKGKSSQEGFYVVASGTSSHLLDSIFKTPTPVLKIWMIPS
jgi:hypothetical protein